MNLVFTQETIEKLALIIAEKSLDSKDFEIDIESIKNLAQKVTNAYIVAFEHIEQKAKTL